MAGTRQRHDPAAEKRVKTAADIDNEHAQTIAKGGRDLPTRIVKSENELAGVILGEEEKEALREAAEAAYVEPTAGDDDGTLVIGNVGHFVVQQPQYVYTAHGEKEEHPGVILNLRDGGTRVSGDELQAVKDAISGKLGADKKRQAQVVGLRVVEASAPTPPMPAWDSLNERDVLTTAKAAGVIANSHDVKRALAYESKRPKDIGGPRENVLAQLKAWEASGLDEPLTNPVAPREAVSQAL